MVDLSLIHILESNTQITLSTTTPNAEIRYTLDDTCPCKEDALRYEGPITITKDTVLRAAALLDGVYSDTIRLELTVANGTEEPENPDDQMCIRDRGRFSLSAGKYVVGQCLEKRAGICAEQVAV